MVSTPHCGLIRPKTKSMCFSSCIIRVLTRLGKTMFTSKHTKALKQSLIVKAGEGILESSVEK